MANIGYTILDYFVAGVTIIDAAGYAAIWGPTLGVAFAFFARRSDFSGTRAHVGQKKRQRERDRRCRILQVIFVLLLLLPCYIYLKFSGALDTDSPIIEIRSKLERVSAALYWIAVLAIGACEFFARRPVPD